MAVLESGLYGPRLGQHFGLDNPPAFVTRSLEKAEIAVTQLKCDRSGRRMTKSLPQEEAYVVELQICRSDRDFWIDGQALGSYNTQQHWISHGDSLYLIYTRRGANNDHVFRNRAPIFIALKA